MTEVVVPGHHRAQFARTAGPQAYRRFYAKVGKVHTGVPLRHHRAERPKRFPYDKRHAGMCKGSAKQKGKQHDGAAKVRRKVLAASGPAQKRDHSCEMVALCHLKVLLTTILTLAMAPEAQHWFEEQRQAYFPAALNRIPAHLSLFHHLPGDASTASLLGAAASAQAPFSMRMDGVRSMGRGVMYTLISPQLNRLHRELAAQFAANLTPQDRQPLRPHVVVQNKVEPAEAKLLLARLQAVFQGREVGATGLLWWEYLGGPWRKLAEYPFSG